METKTVIITGSRTITDYAAVVEAIESSPWYGSIGTVYVGDVRGVDKLALRWCKENGITYYIFRAEWEEYGKSAGPERNRDMIRFGGEAVIALWDGESKGTRNMLWEAEKAGIPCHVRHYKQESQAIGPEVKI